MAKRLSSIFSLGSSSPDARTSTSRPLSAYSPDLSTIERPPSALTSAKSTPDLRPGTRSGKSQMGQQLEAAGGVSPIDASRLSPMMSPALLSANENGGRFSPTHRKPVLQQAGWTEAGRPASRNSGAGSRQSSADGRISNSHTASPARSRPTTPNTEQSKLSKKRLWLPSSRSRPGSEAGYVDQPTGFHAWTIAHPPYENTYYDLTPLVGFQKVPELWKDDADTYIHLNDKNRERGPSFKIDSALFASSRKLVTAAYGNAAYRKSNVRSQSRQVSHETSQSQLLEGTSALKIEPVTSPPASQYTPSTRSSSLGHSSHFGLTEDDNQPNKREIHIGITLDLQANTVDPNAQLSARDIDIMVTIRNAFALLAGVPLVATPTRSSIFPILLEVAEFLQQYDFTNLDGSSLGEEVATSFGHHVAHFKLGDVRSSREKNLEAIILGERMRYWPLYNEGFVHAVGRYDALKALRSPNYRYISDTARERIERANIELSSRLLSIRTRLEDFEYPSLWAGIANSRTSSDSKGVRFKAWRAAFGDMRSHVMSFYKARYGAWPPKARSKKNNFEESGLNRILLRELFDDFSDLYDALVDRTSLTNRQVGFPSNDLPDDTNEEPTSRALRRLLEEYDRSTPPVQPPIPFDTPRLPSLHSIRPNHHQNPDSKPPKSKSSSSSRALDPSDLNLVLLKSYNLSHNQNPMKATPFIDAFTAFERRCARGKSIQEITDLRVGQWIFLYAVIQALPPVVIDAPGLLFTTDVEYFLCQAPRGGAPWVQENPHNTPRWYGITGSSGVVSLPADVVEHSVDAIYRRSHCWTMAEKWAGPLAAVDLDPDPNNNTSPPSSSFAPTATPANAPTANPSSRNPSISSPPLPKDLPPPPPTSTDDQLQPPIMPGSRPDSRRGSSASPSRNRRASMGMALGLEQLPLPAGVSPTGSRPTSRYDPEMSFERILAKGEAAAEGGKGGKK